MMKRYLIKIIVGLVIFETCFLVSKSFGKISIGYEPFRWLKEVYYLKGNSKKIIFQKVLPREEDIRIPSFSKEINEGNGFHFNLQMEYLGDSIQFFLDNLNERFEFLPQKVSYKNINNHDYERLEVMSDEEAQKGGFAIYSPEHEMSNKYPNGKVLKHSKYEEGRGVPVLFYVINEEDRKYVMSVRDKLENSPNWGNEEKYISQDYLKQWDKEHTLTLPFIDKKTKEETNVICIIGFGVRYPWKHLLPK